jgi:hypothetical protein
MKYLGLLCCLMPLTSLSFADKLVNLNINGPQSPQCSGAATVTAWWTPADYSCTFNKSILFPLATCHKGGEFSDTSGNVGLEEALGQPHCKPTLCCCWSIQGPDIQVRVNDACTTGLTPVWVTGSDCDY